MDVGLDGVEPLILQPVSRNLVHQTDAASFLLHVDDDAFPFLLYHLHGFVELLAAVATPAAENVARRTGRVYTHEHRFVFLPRTLDECHVFQSVRLAERNQMESAVLRRQFHLVAHLDARLLFQTVGNDVLDADDLHAPFLRTLLQIRHTCHGAVLVHDFHEHACREAAGQLAEVDGRLGMARAAQHAVVLGIERIDVSRPAEGLGGRFRIGQCPDGLGTVVGGDARRAAFQLVYRDGERRAEHGRVVGHLMGQVQFVGT